MSNDQISSEVTDLRQLEDSKSLKDCRANFAGFSTLAAAEQQGPSGRVIYYPSMNQPERVAGAAEEGTTIPEIGCLFTRHADIYGCGNVLIGGKLVTEDVASSLVATEWHNDSRHTLESRIVVEIKDRVISMVGPGHRIYGHWLVEFLPRLMVAVETLGDAINDFVVLLPSDTPEFAIRLCALFFGPLNFRLYDPDKVILRCDTVCLPTFPFSRRHHFHSKVKDLLSAHRPKVRGGRKLCISRRMVEGKTAGAVKNFRGRQLFEETAAYYGYELVFPETFSIADQVKMFNDAAVVIGEFGSALHNSIFCGPDTIIGAAGFFNDVQLRLCALTDQISIYLVPEEEASIKGVIHYSCRPDRMIDFFDAIEAQLLGTSQV